MMRDVFEINEPEPVESAGQILNDKDYKKFHENLIERSENVAYEIISSEIPPQEIENALTAIKSQNPNILTDDEILLKYFDLLLALSTSHKYLALLNSEIVSKVFDKYFLSDDPLFESAVNSILPQYLMFASVSKFFASKNLLQHLKNKIESFLDGSGSFSALTIPGELKVAAILVQFSEEPNECYKNFKISEICIKLFQTRETANSALEAIGFICRKNELRKMVDADQNLLSQTISCLKQNYTKSSDPVKKANFVTLASEIFQFNDGLDDRASEITFKWYKFFTSNSIEMLYNILMHTNDEIVLSGWKLIASIYRFNWFFGEIIKQTPGLLDKMLTRPKSFYKPVEDLKDDIFSDVARRFAKFDLNSSQLNRIKDYLKREFKKDDIQPEVVAHML